MNLATQRSYDEWSSTVIHTDYRTLRTVDLSTIHDLFNSAKQNGLKRPKLYLNDLTLTPAPTNGRNAGAIYVKQGYQYAGKVTPEGKYYSADGADRTAIFEQLQELADRPADSLIAHGRKTGDCACCGRPLTKKESIERGVGPICAKKWGLV